MLILLRYSFIYCVRAVIKREDLGKCRDGLWKRTQDIFLKAHVTDGGNLEKENIAIAGKKDVCHIK